MGARSSCTRVGEQVCRSLSLWAPCVRIEVPPVPFQKRTCGWGIRKRRTPYGLAKKMLLVQSQAYRDQYGFDSIFLLPTNLYGPGDNFDPSNSHVIPALIRKCLEAQDRGDQEIVAWGDGSPTREFLYVDDAAEAIVLAAEQYDSSDPINVGSSVEISIKERQETIARLCGFTGAIMEFHKQTQRPAAA
ncbi:MAG: NAD-dependent epimerase/dehydratase family protein [Caldilineaceae bacterium]